MIFLGLLVMILFFFWPVILVVGIIFIAWLFWPKRKFSCLCSKKFYSEKSLYKHKQVCTRFQEHTKNEYQRNQQRRKEEEARQQRQEQEKRKEWERKEEWRKNWKSGKKNRFSEEDFWKIQEDIDERKEKATEKLWDTWFATSNDNTRDRIWYKIEEKEEEFEEEEEELWEHRWNSDWYENTQGGWEYQKAKEEYERAKEQWKRTTGREWDENFNWDDIFSGETVDLDECYKTLDLAVGTKFSEVKKRFRELALKYHPDKCKDKKIGDEKFKEIFGAYETIKKSVMTSNA